MQNIGTEQQQDKYRNHAQVWELLPWFINGSLAAEEMQRVLDHTAVCLICRKELGLQAVLRDAVKNHELDEVMVAASFDRLSAKLHEQDPGLRVMPRKLQASPEKSAGKFAAALNLWLHQYFKPGYFAAAVLLLAVTVILPGITGKLLPANNTFRTLSNTPTAAPITTGDLRLIFADSVNQSERDAILDSAGLSIVAGPDDRGLYFVDAADVSADALEATLTQLRSNEKILFAEPAIATSTNSPPP